MSFPPKTFAIAGLLGAAFALFGVPGFLITYRLHSSSVTITIFGVVAIIGGALLMVAVEGIQLQAEWRREAKIEVIEQDLRENPEKPRLAWELAQARLESYLARNLSQVRSIYVLTVIVMMVGFTLIGVGAYEAFQNEERFKAAVLSAISGVLVSFIGGTFLVLYRATMAQAKDYVTILERINAVGMSVQILESLTTDSLKQESLAEIAKSLLQMYSPQPQKASKKTRTARQSKEL